MLNARAVEDARRKPASVPRSATWQFVVSGSALRAALLMNTTHKQMIEISKLDFRPAKKESI